MTKKLRTTSSQAKPKLSNAPPRFPGAPPGGAGRVVVIDPVVSGGSTIVLPLEDLLVARILTAELCAETFGLFTDPSLCLL